MILPFLDQQQVYAMIDFTLTPFGPTTPTPTHQNRIAATTVIDVFNCPSDNHRTQIDTDGVAKVATLNYRMSSGSYNTHDTDSTTGGPKNNDQVRNGIFGRDSSTAVSDVKDGLSVTVAGGEATFTISANGRWAGGWNQNLTPVEADDSNRLMRNGRYKMNDPANPGVVFSSMHEGGAHFLMADGAVPFIGENIQHSNSGACRSVGPTPSTNPGTCKNYDWNGRTTGNNNPYGIYQRLMSKADGIPIGEF